MEGLNGSKGDSNEAARQKLAKDLASDENATEADMIEALHRKYPEIVESDPLFEKSPKKEVENYLMVFEKKIGQWEKFAHQLSEPHVKLREKLYSAEMLIVEIENSMELYSRAWKKLGNKPGRMDREKYSILANQVKILKKEIEDALK